VDTDADLISESLSKPESFGRLFDRHFTDLYTFVARRAHPAETDDVVGETFRQAFELRSRYDLERANAMPWLIGISLNIMRNEARRLFRQSAALARFAPTLLLDRTVRPVDEEVEAKYNEAMIACALERLPPLELEVLLLTTWEAMTYEEVSIALDIPVGTVRSRVHRARQHLHRILGPDITSTFPMTGEPR
jgi:RNA polymerase sigma factor (sigma-70 family)